MGLNLTIDRGNTMTKLALWDDQQLVMSRQIVKATTGKIISAIAGYDVSKAILCTVAGDFDGLSIEMKRRKITFSVLKSTRKLPISIGYSTPASLGPDRLAAAVGAASLFPGRDLLVADLGTAATYDRVSADGCFRGGNIAPGIGMRLRALHRFTACLPVVQGTGDVPLWGYSTETAMRAGAVRGVCAEIAYYKAAAGPEAIVVLTGGWSAEVAGMLDFDVEISENLVLIGLNRILQYNEI